MNKRTRGMSLTGWVILGVWITLTLCPLLLAMSDNTPACAVRWMIGTGLGFGLAGHLLRIPQTAAELLRG